MIPRFDTNKKGVKDHHLNVKFTKFIRRKRQLKNQPVMILVKERIKTVEENRDSTSNK